VFGSVLLPIGVKIDEEEDELQTDSDSDDEDAGHVSRLLPHGRSEFRVSDYSRRTGPTDQTADQLLRKGSFKPTRSNIFAKGL